MVIRADRHFQVDQPLLVQLLQQLPVQVTHQAPPWLAAILTCFQLLWTQCSELLLTCSQQAESFVQNRKPTDDLCMLSMHWLHHACGWLSHQAELLNFGGVTTSVV